jgi:Cd2+/Zn2+-exporting ATPase
MVLGCPGALVIGVPVSTVAGIGNGAKNGVMFKGSQVMDAARKIDEIAFDKTGTLTVGHPEVNKIEVLSGNKDEVVNLAANIESQSNHPLAKAMAKLSGQKIDQIETKTVKGKGMIADLDRERYYLGNLALIE